MACPTKKEMNLTEDKFYKHIIKGETGGSGKISGMHRHDRFKQHANITKSEEMNPPKGIWQNEYAYTNESFLYDIDKKTTFDTSVYTEKDMYNGMQEALNNGNIKKIADGYEGTVKFSTTGSINGTSMEFHGYVDGNGDV